MLAPSLPPSLPPSLSPSLSLDIPANGTLHHPFPVSYIINNKTQLIQELEARISTSDAFMYSGKRHVSHSQTSNHSTITDMYCSC